MKLNSKITIEVKWDEEEQLNKTSITFDPELTLSEVFTSIEMGVRSLKDVYFSKLENVGQLEEIFNKKVRDL